MAKTRRIRSLQLRLEILDSVRGQVEQEIRRAERGLPSLVRGDGSAYVRAASEGRLRSALVVAKADDEAKKDLLATVRRLATGSWGFGLERAMLLLVMLSPDDAPRSLRDDLLLAAAEAGMPRDDLARAAQCSRPTLREALSRARRRRR